MPAGNPRALLRLVRGSVVFGACVAPVAAISPAAEPVGPPPLVAGAAIPWHASIREARQAALVSRRHVLVIFTSSSSESGAALARELFPAAETVALLTAGFEPVRIDVDVDPASARAFGITSIPTACILDAEEHLLAKFDCPATPAAFAAAVGHASSAAAVAHSSGAARAASTPRQQSDFVTHAMSSAPPIPSATPTPSVPDPAVNEEPTLAAAPPAWTAEPATRPMPFGSSPPANPAVRTTLEPAAAPSAAGTAWLDTKPSGGPDPAGATGPSATVAPPAEAQAASPEPAPEAKKPSLSDSFFAALRKPFTIFAQPAPAQKEAAAIERPPVGTVSAAAAAPVDPLGSMPLGLEGYCPVSLVDKGAWAEGRAQWGARHRGRTYLFAGAEQQRAFLADPDRYAPALSGDDPVLACDSGRQVAGQRRYGVSYQSRTYLFSSPETRAAFAADPQRYTTRVIIAERPAASDRVVR